MYRIMILDAKEEMRIIISSSENINNDEFIEIKFPYSNGIITDKDFNLIDENEFTYKGSMYDAVRTDVHDNYIYFYCINDSKEEKIDQQLENHIRDNLTNNPASQKKSNSIEKNLVKEYLTNQALTLIFPPICFTNYIFTKDNPVIVWLDTESPPPEIYLTLKI